MDTAHVGQGHRVLVHAAGGVGHLAVQGVAHVALAVPGLPVPV